MEQDKPKKQRLFRWALWWGLGITLVSIAMLFIPGIDDGQDPVGDLMYQLLGKGFWLLLIIIGIIMPIIEEVTFRLWGNGKVATGIISSILMSGFMLISFNWWVGLITLAATFGVTLFVKDRNRRLFVMMLLSSTLFMAAHTANYGGAFISTALALVEKFGFALLASYLVINHNILWSMVLHILNNSIACVALFIGLSTITPTTMTGEGHQITIRPLILEKGVEMRYWPTVNGDTLTFNNELDLMVINLLEWDSTNSYSYFYDTVAYYENSPLHVKYNMQVVFDANKPHDYTAVVRTLEQNGWIDLDTTVEQAYMITIVDSTKRIGADSVSGPMWVGAYTLQRNCLPILQPEGFKYFEWPVESRGKLGSIEETRLLLEKAGLGLEPIDRSMTMIGIKVLHDPMADL